MAIRSILYAWLPCKKIYPLGATYLANYIHRLHPEIDQHILDLSLIPRSRRRAALREAMRAYQPELVCFSWRDIQIFAPHEGNDSLKYAFEFYYSPNPLKRVTASFKGLQYLYAYYRDIRENISYPHLIRREFPKSSIMIGGGAFSVFARQLIGRLPEGVIGLLGEGEEALRKFIEGKPLGDERSIVQEGRRIAEGSKPVPAHIDQGMIDLKYLSGIFPQYRAYTSGTIGIQTKRGCPYDCQFCEYPYIEGKRVRYRKPEEVLADMRQHVLQWGVRDFWFTDAQFFTGKESFPQCKEIMERIIAEQMAVTWSGYIRTSLIDAQLADLMVRSGVGDMEVSITSGSQKVLNELHMGFKLEHLYDGCRYLKEAGFQGKILLNYSLNSPGETEETLADSIASYKKIAAILGEDRVIPMLFFLGIQPNTGLEERLLEEGYLSKGYNPLSLNPLAIRKLIYNPAPLSKLIAKACLPAWDQPVSEKRSLLQLQPHYADDSLAKVFVENTGKTALLNLERTLAKKS